MVDGRLASVPTYIETRLERLFRLPLVLLITIALALLCFAFLAKVRLFLSLNYTSDLFSHLQMSQSYLYGRPLFTENFMGSFSHAHNYLISPLLAPLTVTLGAPGLFLASAGLTGLACLSGIYSAWLTKSWNQMAIVFGLLLGPVSFYLFDDPLYGWHPEYLMLPFGVLMSLALLRGGRSWLFWGGLLILVREDGALLGLCLHLVFVLGGLDRPNLNFRFVSRLLRITITWLSPFGAGMALQHLFGQVGAGRLSEALLNLGRALDSPESLSGVSVMLTDSLTLLATGAILWLGRLRAMPLLYATIATAPLLALTLVASAAYLPDLLTFRMHGILWPSRFVMLWTLLTATLLVACKTRAPVRTGLNSIYIIGLTALVGLSWYTQATILKELRAYNLEQRLQSNRKAYRHLNPRAALRPLERNLLECLGRDIPSSIPVATDPYFLAYFHQHDAMSTAALNLAHTTPLLTVCDLASRLPYSSGCEKALDSTNAQNFLRRKQGQLGLAYEPSLDLIIRPCLKGG